MSKYYDNRRCHPLVLYQENEYQVLRNKHGIIHVERKHTVKVAKSFTDKAFVWWRNLTQLDGYWSAYIFSGSRAKKLAVNRKYAEKGETWIERWKMLLAGGLWTVKCDDWDGQGTPCPIQRNKADGIPGCPVEFFFMGYGGGYPPKRELPGVCDGPLNTTFSVNVCLPSGRDKHGFSMAHLHEVRREIWARKIAEDETVRRKISEKETK